MGWCHEFGPQIHEGCAQPMVAGASSCTCGECGVVCRGRFNGCTAVWARGPLAPVVRAPLNAIEAEDRTAVDLPLVSALDVTFKPTEPSRPNRFEPAPRVQTPRPQVPRPPAPRRMPPPVRAAATDGDGLALLRARIEGLRGEVKALGDSLGKRESRAASPATDPG